MSSHPKVYVLTRADLSPGQQATQSAHAAFVFSVEHPLLMETWFQESTYLVLLSVPDEHALIAHLVKLREAGIVCSAWREPDLGNELTAVAVAPSLAAQRLLANLPLTLREPATVA